MRKVHIVGVGMVRIDRYYDKGYMQLIRDAAVSAFNDVKSYEPEAIVVGNMLSSTLYNQDSLAALALDAIGFRGLGGLKVEAACGSGGHAVIVGYSLVASGLYDQVMVVGVEKMSDYPTSTITSALAQAANAEYEYIYGVSFPALNALIMRLYMLKYEARREDMALWPVRMHEYGSRNPYAQLRNRITIEDVINSPIVSDPIRLMDSAPIGDGAAVIILSSEDVARKLSDTPVEIAGVGLGSDGLDLSSREELLNPISIKRAAEKAFRMSKLTPSDIDVAEIHDAFTITALLSIEGLGFADLGESWKLVKDGRFAVGDKPSVNLSGGLKARGHPVGATGVYQIAEIAMQLRGDFPGVKLDKAEKGLAMNTGGVGTLTSVVILKR
ncbi:MAG: thiolase domain-containing protein [Ignisphaera sp.]|nr:thiolase domain-containing protein [Ignisphaera sp.]MCX8168230.1 thiolase domain-containing protein [Ignisphaera sp.]MDW8084901.1 thiolase domain-containing protein [Ignisphaera sp.]